jgi:hypothetical protein
MKNTIMLTSLQGITAKEQASIVILGECESYSHFVNYLLQNGYTAESYDNVWNLVKKFNDKINGYVKFDKNAGEDINSAAIVSGMENLLMVCIELEDAVIKQGIKKKFDFTAMPGNSYDRKKEIFNTYKTCLNKSALIHQSPSKLQLRDLAIALNLFCFYTDEKDKKNCDFRNEVFAWADKNVPVLGWTED